MGAMTVLPVLFSCGVISPDGRDVKLLAIAVKESQGNFRRCESCRIDRTLEGAIHPLGDTAGWRNRPPVYSGSLRGEEVNYLPAGVLALAMEVLIT